MASIDSEIERIFNLLMGLGSPTNTRGSFSTSVTPTPCAAPNISAAIEDIQTNGLGKTALDKDGKRCLLGSVIENGGVAVRTLLAIVRELPTEPGDQEIINDLTFRPTNPMSVTQAVNRIAAFNDADSTTAEDVIMILKKLEG